MLYRINHIHLKAPDPEKTAEWWVRAFNFRIVVDTVRDSGDRFIRCESADGLAVNISGARADERMGDADARWGLEHFGFDVEDIEAEVQRPVGLGAVLKEGPVGADPGPRIAFLAAPGDVRIELIQPRRDERADP
jgi:catechol 2,3-dioxygenase-like lactoylglutathione lyase family enzyme